MESRIDIAKDGADEIIVHLSYLEIAELIKSLTMLLLGGVIREKGNTTTAFALTGTIEIEEEDNDDQ